MSDSLIGAKILCSNNQTYTIAAGNDFYPLSIVNKEGKLIDHVFNTCVDNIVVGATLFVGDPSFTTKITKVIKI